MSELREQTAKAIALCKGLCEWTNWDTLPQVYKDQLFYPLADQILSLFREGIEKLKVLSDEEIQTHLDHSGTLIERGGYIAQAQIDDIKRQLFEKLEGK